MQTRSPFARLFAAPEIESGFAAVQALANDLAEQGFDGPYPLYLHGPTGSGKTTLVSALVEDVTRRKPSASVSALSAYDFALPNGAPQKDEQRSAFHSCDLLIIEDLQHLPARATETLASVMDERRRHGLPTVITALTGPSRLRHRGEKFPARLTNRLAAGLVVALEPLQAPSRLRFLQEMARRRKVNVAPDVLSWLADQLTGGGRQLEGALQEVETLQKLQRRQLVLADLHEQFAVQEEFARPTVERILERVGDYFEVAPKQLCSARRYRRYVLPRQVSMYLARRLTPLSLQQIGACFGGRDHTTVLHACKKVEEAMKSDTMLSGTVRRLHAELT